MPLIDPGRKAPAFSLTDQCGAVHTLAACAGKPVVLYFYPKDDTSGCTREASEFHNAMPGFKRMKALVYGVSPQDEASKEKFAAKHGLTFPLLADHGSKVCRRYGVWAEKSMYGRSYMGVVRTTYLIGPDGGVVRRWDNVKVPGHAEEVLGAVRDLRASRKPRHSARPTPSK